MKITIITVCYNARRYIEQTILSVLSQTWPDKEYIVIDGGSTDGTIDIIKKYKNRINQLVSEPDRGIADAMNKGIRLASGDFLIFIHSDDYFLYAESLERAVNAINGKHELYVFPVVAKLGKKESLSMNYALGPRTNFKLGSCHQGHLIKRELFHNVGEFDLQFKICMDYDFALRCYRNRASSRSMNFPISVMRLTGISSRLDWKGLRERLDEERKAQMKNCPSPFFCFVYCIYWFFYIPYRYVKYALNS